MKRNQSNNPLFDLAVEMQIERTDNTLFLREQIATGNFGESGDKFVVCTTVGGLAFNVDIERKDGARTSYLLDIRPILEKVLENSEEWDKAPKIPNVKKG